MCLGQDQHSLALRTTKLTFSFSVLIPVNLITAFMRQGGRDGVIVDIFAAKRTFCDEIEVSVGFCFYDKMKVLFQLYFARSRWNGFAWALRVPKAIRKSFVQILTVMGLLLETSHWTQARPVIQLPIGQQVFSSTFAVRTFGASSYYLQGFQFYHDKGMDLGTAMRIVADLVET